MPKDLSYDIELTLTSLQVDTSHVNFKIPLKVIFTA